MALLSITYTTVAKVKRFMSADYANAAADHNRDEAADTDVIEDAINWATEELNSYLLQRYSPAGLQASELVSRWATLFASCDLAITRGNPTPESWMVRREEIIERLKLIAAGVQQLPGIALREDMRPAMSNLIIDRRYRHSKIRVTPTNSSTPPTKLTQDQTTDNGQHWE